jgi:hypothetical protein
MPIVNPSPEQPVPTRPFSKLKFQELQSYAGRDAARWATAAEPVVAAVRAVLGDAGTVTVDPEQADLRITWTAGPSVAQVVDAIDDVVNDGPTGWEQQGNSELPVWYGLSARLVREVSPEAVGIAALAATIGVGCPVCEYDHDDPWRQIFDLHLNRPDPHRLVSHPNLAAVLDLKVLVRTAEVTATVTATGARFYSTGRQSHNDLVTYICRAGHLPGLLRVDGALHPASRPA